MNRLFLIIKREYVQAVCKKSFIITTILVPILSIVLCGVLPMFLSQAKSDEQKVVTVIDRNDGSPYASQIKDSQEYHYTIISDTNEQTDYHTVYQNSEQALYAIVVIPQDFATKTQVNIYSEKSVNVSLEREIAHSLRSIVRNQRIEGYGIDSLEQMIKYCDPDIVTTNIKWSKEGEETRSSAEISMMIGLTLAILTYMFFIIYGAMIMNSVVEEKTNRIVEVIISTCKPIELMLGKIVGVALVGITQIAIWSILLGILGAIFGIGSMASTMGGMPDSATLVASQEALVQQNSEIGQIIAMLLSIDYAQIIISFVLYFIGGYLLYASLFAAFGSAVDQASDASQFTGPIMMIMIFALYAGMFCMENPDGPLAFWCSMIPFTSPVVMMIRLPYDLPWYELVLSLVVLYVSAFGILWLSSRIYRTGILMYGRKFTIKEILRWIK